LVGPRPRIGTFLPFTLMFDLAESFGRERDLGWFLLMSPTLAGWRALASTEVTYLGPMADRTFREARPELREWNPHLDAWR
jgi:hypothetical protein